MNNSTAKRARRLAFALGGAAVVFEMLVLLAVSHARAPEGQFLAGAAHCAPAPAPANSPSVILLRQLELVL